MNPWSVNWVDDEGKQRTDPLDVNCSCFDPTKTVALNPAAWENIPDGQWGAQQSTLRGYRGIRLPNESANFSRNFRLSKEGRVNLNVRVEFQNIFNRTFLSAPSVANPNLPIATTNYNGTAINNTGFGSVATLNGIGTQPRSGQIVTRFTF